jgi:CRISPR/Cas system-associated exonuclease Cas4 (RecB family)
MTIYAWSWTGLSTFRQCPFQFEQTALRKAFTKTSGPALERGSKVHEALATWLLTGEDEAFDALRLPSAPIIRQLVGRMNGILGPPRAECSVAVDAEWRPCGFFDEQVWGRGLVDVLWHANDAAVLIDWKTGSSAADPLQLRLLAYLVLAHLADVDVVRAAFFYVDQPEITKQMVKITVERSEFAKIATDGVKELDDLYTAINLENFQPKPGKHCNWCPVETCPYYRQRLGSR